MSAPVSLKAVVDELELTSNEFQIYFNKRTGEFVLITDDELWEAEQEEPLPDLPEGQDVPPIHTAQILESDDYIPLPSQYDIHEWAIMKRFCYTIEDDELRDEMLYRIHGAGAFRFFKDGIYRYNLADDWYRYREAELEKIAIEWLEENDIPFTREDEDNIT